MGEIESYSEDSNLSINYSFYNFEANTKRVCVIIPTYNESRTIGQVLDLLFFYSSLRQHSPVDTHALIVDDSSPDGTADIVIEHQKNNSNIHILVRKKKEGLGMAYREGMQYALQQIKPDIIVEMDGDLQHNPRDVFRLVEEMNDGTDMVIGSRYVAGGQVPDNWSVGRKLVSNMSNLATKMLLKHNGIKDYTGGFRAIKSDVLSKIDFNSLESKGYAFQAVLLDSVISLGGTVKEIPIRFSERAAGDSKMNLKDLFEGGALLLKRRITRDLTPIQKRN